MHDETLLFDAQHEQYVVIHDYIRRWGNHASITLVERNCSFFSTARIEGAIGYHEEVKCVVVFGNPLCAPEDMPALVHAFHTFCKKQGKRVLYLNATESFAHWFVEHRKGSFVSAVSELVVNPARDVKQETGKHAWLLRNKYAKATGLGIRVHEYSGYDADLEKNIENLGVEWQQQRKGVQAYLFPLKLFHNRIDKRWFYAEYNNRIVGLLVMNRLEAHQGWYINMLLYASDAPSMVSEYLVLRTLEHLRAEQCDFFSIGAALGMNIGPMGGFSPVATWLCRQGFSLVKKLLPLYNRERFWHKFRPSKTAACIVFESSVVRPYELITLLRAVNILQPSSS